MRDYIGKGIQPAKSLNLFDRCSEANDLIKMAKDQVQKMLTNSNSYVLLSWTLTQKTFAEIANAIVQSTSCPLFANYITSLLYQH